MLCFSLVLVSLHSHRNNTFIIHLISKLNWSFLNIYACEQHYYHISMKSNMGKHSSPWWLSCRNETRLMSNAFGIITLTCVYQTCVFVCVHRCVDLCKYNTDTYTCIYITIIILRRDQLLFEREYGHKRSKRQKLWKLITHV